MNHIQLYGRNRSFHLYIDEDKVKLKFSSPYTLPNLIINRSSEDTLASAEGACELQFWLRHWSWRMRQMEDKD